MSGMNSRSATAVKQGFGSLPLRITGHPALVAPQCSEGGSGRAPISDRSHALRASPFAASQESKQLRLDLTGPGGELGQGRFAQIAADSENDPADLFPHDRIIGRYLATAPFAFEPHLVLDDRLYHRDLIEDGWIELDRGVDTKHKTRIGSPFIQNRRVPGFYGNFPDRISLVGRTTGQLPRKCETGRVRMIVADVELEHGLRCTGMPD